MQSSKPLESDAVLSKKRHTSLADIARYLKVSKASVAAALSGGGGNTRVSETTIRRVQEVARQLNYRTNASARAISRQRFNTIGFFVVKKKATDYAASDTVVLEIVDAAEKHGQTVIMVCVPSAPAGKPIIPRPLSENCLDALIVQNAMVLSEEFHAAIESSRVPVIYINEKAPTNAVYIDDVEGGRMMTEFLISEGFNRIAVLSPVTAFPHYSAADRVQGYTEAMSLSGLEPIVKNPPSAIWEAEVMNWLVSTTPPEVIFCTSDDVALRLQSILYNLKLRIPEDIAIAGCDDELLAKHSTVPLTTLHIPFTEMARISVEQVVRLIENGGPVPSVVLHAELVVRASTRRG
jgi:LacI family transcriptional regulator